MNEILIYSDIGDSFWYESVSAQSVKEQLDTFADGSDVTVRINSPGGSVFDGFAIYNLLNQWRGQVTVYVDGLAASAASVVAMAGNEILIADTAFMMIHNPWTVIAGSSEEMRETAELLDKIKGSIVRAYQTQARLSEDDLVAMMDAETWFDAREAVDSGLATGILDGLEDLPVAASLSKPWIHNAPKAEGLDRAVADKLQTMRQVAAQLNIDNRRQLLAATN